MGRNELFNNPPPNGRYFDRIVSGKSRDALNLGNLLKFDHLNEDVRRHLKRVYILLTFTVIAACFGSYLGTTLIFSPNGLMASFVASIAIILVLGFTVSTQENALWRSGLLVMFGAFQGILVSPLIMAVASVDPTIPMKAFFLTAIVFVCFTLAALLAEQRKFLYLYGILSSCLFSLCFLSLINVYMHSPLLDNVWLYGGLILFSLFVAVDTQIIIERALQGDSDSVHSALDLFLDALNIFVRIMIILSRDHKESGGTSIV